MKPSVEARLIKVMAEGPGEEITNPWERFEPHFEAARPLDHVRHFKTNSELLSTLLKVSKIFPNIILCILFFISEDRDDTNHVTSKSF